MNLSNWLVFLVSVAPPTVLPKVLTLQDALHIARSQQPAVRLANAQVAAAEARARQARAALLPQATATASYSRSTGNYVARPGAVPSVSGVHFNNSAPNNTSYNFLSFGGSVTQLVYDFDQSLGRWRSSQSSASAQEQNALATASIVDYNVRGSYFAAHAAYAMVQVGEENLANQQKHLKQIAGYIEVGTRAEIDLAQAKNDVATAKVQLITYQNAYETAKVQLNQAMGVEANVAYDVTDEAMPPIPNEDADDGTLVDEALRTRPELANLRQQVAAAESMLRAQRGTYGPSIVVQGNITDQGNQLTAMGWNWSAGVMLNWPLLAGGLNVAQIDEAEANLNAVNAQAEAVRQSVRLDVEQARLAVRAGKQTLEAAGDALVNARERLKYAEGRYETGAGSIIELGDAQVAVTTAAAQVVQAHYQLDNARAALLKAMGHNL